MSVSQTKDADSAIVRHAKTNPARLSRRRAIKILSGLGVGTMVFRRALAAEAEKGEVTPEMVAQAEWIAGIELSEEDRQSTARALTHADKQYQELRAVALKNGVPPAMMFQAAPWQARTSAEPRGEVRPIETAAPERPTSSDDLAFLPLVELAALLRTRQVTSVELTRLYLERLRYCDGVLKCVVNYTEETALEQAERADREIAAGRYRGPLHGVPWGAKDLIAYPGYPTTWGATPFKDQVLDVKATVARRLEEAGAVLIAKLSLGALAQGDLWFGGRTRNPWNPRQGSSGSSAGPACATAAGLVGFTLGSETQGSIVTPCWRCGATGLRPTFGRVSRYGCMTLSWSMDKIGPIARSVEDCALVLAAIHGFDSLDGTTVDRPFHWPMKRDLRSLKVGYFETTKPRDERPELDVLTDLGVELVPIKLPDKYPTEAVSLILGTEAAAVFDELTRAGVTEGLNRWPHTFRRGQFVPAVEYLRANRVRTLIMQEMDELMSEVDAYVGGSDVTLTNLTGHPSVVLPNGFHEVKEIEVPYGITFTGRLFGETELLALAHAYQQATGFHLRRPPMDRVTEENAAG